MIIITGFEPFNKKLTNASEKLARLYVNNELVEVLILPVVHEECFNALVDIDTRKVEAIIHLGESSFSELLQFESTAVNLANFSIEDNKGNKITNTHIHSNGQKHLMSTINVDLISGLDLPVESTISDSAGSFICNELFYRSLTFFAGTNTKIGFFHIPSSLSSNEERLYLFKDAIDLILVNLRIKHV